MRRSCVSERSAVELTGTLNFVGFDGLSSSEIVAAIDSSVSLGPAALLPTALLALAI